MKKDTSILSDIIALMDEKVLVSSIKSGNSKAFEKMFSLYVPKLKSFLIRMCNNYHTAEDILQETMLKVHKNIKSFKGRSKFSTWLFQIAANNCKMFKRKNFKNEETLTTKHEKSIDSMEKIENNAFLNELLIKIPPIYRAAVILSDIQGFTAKEIADIFKISLQNAKIRIARGRKMLANLAKKQNE